MNRGMSSWEKEVMSYFTRLVEVGISASLVEVLNLTAHGILKIGGTIGVCLFFGGTRFWG